MIFTQQLGTLEGRSVAEAIKSIANHVRRMQEELEYRLSVLDSSNISEINADQTTIMMSDDKTLQSVLEDADGNYSELVKAANGLSVRVGNAEGSLTVLTATANGLSTRVSTAEGNISTLTQTANGIESRVSTAEGNISTVTQTANGLETRVSDAEGNITTIISAHNTLVTRVNTAEGKYSTIEQNANKIAAIVANVGSGGTVTAASIAAKIQNDSALIQMIASKVNTDGFVTQSVFEQTENKIALMVSEVGDDDGNVTAASIAAKISEDSSLIELIAEDVAVYADFVTIADLEDPDNTTVIDGGEIFTTTIYASGDMEEDDLFYAFVVRDRNDYDIGWVGYQYLDTDWYDETRTYGDKLWLRTEYYKDDDEIRHYPSIKLSAAGNISIEALRRSESAIYIAAENYITLDVSSNDDGAVYIRDNGGHEWKFNNGKLYLDGSKVLGG